MKYLLLLFLFIFSFNFSNSQQWWAEQTSGVSTTLTSVSVASGAVWICGYSSVVLRTTNNGTNWTNVSIITPNVSLINICGIDANNALVAGYIGSDTWIWKTTNGGTTWIQTFSQPGGFVDGIAMRPGSVTEGLMLGDPVGGRWTIFRTTNAGSNWDSSGCYLVQNGSEAGWNNSLYWSKLTGAAGDSAIWFGTNNNRLYHSTNRGYNWISQATPTEQNTYAVGFLFNIGLAAGATLIGSQTFGYSWSTVNGTPGTGNFGGLVGFFAPVDENPLFQGYCWYVRSDNKIYRGISVSGGYAVEYTAPAGNFRHINTAQYAGPIWAIRDNGGISACVGCYVSGITPLANETPTQFTLGQNYPNPFNPTTTFEFSVPSRSHVKICVYNSIGQNIEVINDGVLNAGTYGVNWNGAKLSSGVYYYSLIARDESSSKVFTQTKKMILIK